MFIILFLLTNMKFMLSKKFKSELAKKDNIHYPWARFLGQIFTGVLLMFILVSATSAVAAFTVTMFEYLLGDLKYTVYQIVLLVTLYLSGVYVTCRLDRWIKRNLPPIFDND